MKTSTHAPYSLLTVGVLLLTGWSLTMILPRYTLEAESTLRIEGTSSIHDWACTVENVTGGATIEAGSTDMIAVSQIDVTVPVDAISCKNKTMDKKVLKAFNVEEHPVIRYVFDGAAVRVAAQEQRFVMSTVGQLSMAGVTQDLTMTAVGERLDDGRMRFSGEVPLLMTDFGMKPPKALLGTLKTGDRVVVHFNVVVKPA